MKDYSIEKIQALLRDFYNLTNIKICIYDRAENELCYYPEKFSPFCALLRQNEEMDKRCQECDKRAFAECKKTYTQFSYTCHAGLLECVSPILYDNKIIGYIALGQTKTEDGNFSKLSEQFPKETQERLSKLFEELPNISMDKIRSAMRILDACTGYEYLKGLVRAGENKIDSLLTEYVNEHLTDDLSVQTLCSRFHLSHGEIYAIFKEYFDDTPADYVKKRRLHNACELLKNTSLPIHKIAQKCGIPDYNYFSKIFKRTFHITPRTYRKIY